MKPVLVVQHLSDDRPGYLATWLGRAGVAFELRNQQAGQGVPDDVSPYAALAVLGGEMSANDALPFLRAEEALIRQAMARDVPVLGHCLGAQLLARALGAAVVTSPAPEIGWQTLQVEPTPAAAAWFGDAGPRTVFHWHFDAFDLPRCGERLAGSAACPNQAFAIGRHLALQFHVEIDAGKIEIWTRSTGRRHAAALRAHAGSVQDNAAMRAGIAAHLAAHQRLADRIYTRWLAGAG